MSGVWVFSSNGVLRLIEKPNQQVLEEASASSNGRVIVGRNTMLVHVATGQVVESHEELEFHLRELGWVPYISNKPELIQYHRSHASLDLISLPKRFADLRSFHMYDIAFKNRSAFIVRDRPPSMT